LVAAPQNASRATAASTRSASVRLSSQLSASVVGIAMASPPAVVSRATQIPPARAEGSTDCPEACKGLKGGDHAENGAEQAQKRRDLGDAVEKAKSPFDPGHPCIGFGGEAHPVADRCIEGRKEYRGEVASARPKQVPRIAIMPGIPRSDGAPDRVVPSDAGAAKIPNLVQDSAEREDRQRQEDDDDGSAEIQKRKDAIFHSATPGGRFRFGSTG
jgi:hypothetical protein